MIKISILIPIILTGFLFSACNSTGSKTNDRGSDSTKNTDGWELLFNGTTTAGWHTYGKDSIGSAWKVEDSTLHLDATTKDGWQAKDGGDIVTDSVYENFHLALEWKIAKGSNSGIMIYVQEDTSVYKYPWESGPEIQVGDNESEGGNIDKQIAGDIFDVAASTSQKFVKPAGQWNHVEIIADKGKLDLYMNGERTLSTVLWDDAWKNAIANSKFKTTPGFGTFKRGRIGLQDHGTDVWYRNIKIKKR